MKVIKLTDFADIGNIKEGNVFLCDGGEVVVADAARDTIRQIAKERWPVTSCHTSNLIRYKARLWSERAKDVFWTYKYLHR